MPSNDPRRSQRQARRRGPATPRLAWRPDPAELTDPQSIAANARGQLTRRQRVALQDQLAGRGGAGCFALVLMLIPLGVVLAARRALSRFLLAARRGPFVLVHLARWELRLPWLHLLLLAFALLWGVLVLRGVIWSMQSWRTTLALRWPSISAGQGIVRWAGTGYEVATSGSATALQPWNGALIQDIPPGVYQVWSLQHGGRNWLLSLTGVDGQAPVSSAGYQPDALRSALIQTRACWPESLSANRAGFLTPDQQRAVAQMRGGALTLATDASVAALSAHWSGQPDEAARAALAQQSVSVVEGFLQKHQSTQLSPTGLVADTVLDLALGNGGQHYPGETAAERRYRLTGRASGNSMDNVFTCEVQGLVCAVGERAYDALVAGLPYRLYALPLAAARPGAPNGVLVNIEPLPRSAGRG